MEILFTTLQALPTGIFSFVLLLGLLVFVHELGHFAAAKYYGVRVETFSLGFGKKIFKFKRGDTTYCISLIPLGGYVKMFGDDPTKEPPEDQKRFSFLHKPVGPRIMIVLAGPLMNLVFAIFLFFCLGVIGERVPSTQIGDIAKTSEAWAFGFRSGDVIKAINGESVRQWKDVKDAIETHAGEELTFDVERANEIVQVKATPKLVDNPFIFSTRSQVGAIEGLGLDSRAPIVGVSNPYSEAGKAGFTPLELIEEINGTKISYLREVEPTLIRLQQEGVDRFKFRIRSMLDPEKADDPSMTRTVEITDIKNIQPAAIMSEIGLRDSQTFLWTVKKGTPGLSLKAAVSESPAAAAGLKAGDRIVKIDNTVINVWEDVLNAVKNYDESSKGLQITYERDGVEKTVQVVPEMAEIPNAQGGLDKRYAIGIVPAIVSIGNAPTVVDYSVGRAIVYGFESSWEYTKLIAMSLVRLVQAQVSPRNIGGVITIGRVASQSFQAGWDVFVKTMAIISINLFLLNLLPVPVLDGGHLVFFGIEAIRGAPLSLRKLEIAQQVGLVLLLTLMVFALFNDITHWISSW